MSAARKVEITNQVRQNWMEQLIEKLAPYSRAITAIVLLAIMAFLGYGLWARNRQVQQERLSDKLFAVSDINPSTMAEAEKTLAELGGSEPGYLLRSKIATYLQQTGNNQLLADKPTAAKNLEQARTYFHQILAGSKNPFLREKAALAVAMCEESLGNMDAAKTAYEKSLNMFPNGLYAQVAKDQLEGLKQPDAAAFIAWYKTATPNKSTEPPAFPGGAFPGLNPTTPQPGVSPQTPPGSILPVDPILDPTKGTAPSTDLKLPETTTPTDPVKPETEGTKPAESSNDTTSPADAPKSDAPKVEVDAPKVDAPAIDAPKATTPPVDPPTVPMPKADK